MNRTRAVELLVVVLASVALVVVLATLGVVVIAGELR